MERKIIEKAIEIYIDDANEKIDESKLNRAINIATNLSNLDYQIDLDDSWVYINNTIIDNKIFDNELVDYRFYDRLSYIDDLILIISEFNNDLPKRKSDLILIKELLFKLVQLNDDEILISIKDHSCLSPTLDKDKFNEICQDILDLNDDI